MTVQTGLLAASQFKTYSLNYRDGGKTALPKLALLKKITSKKDQVASFKTKQNTKKFSMFLQP